MAKNFPMLIFGGDGGSLRSPKVMAQRASQKNAGFAGVKWQYDGITASKMFQ